MVRRRVLVISALAVLGAFALPANATHASGRHQVHGKPGVKFARAASSKKLTAGDAKKLKATAPTNTTRQTSRPVHGFASVRLSGGEGQPQHREMTIYLPKGYGDDPNRTYPVMYMQDGQNVFEYGPAGFGNGWDVATSMEAEVAAGRAEPAIIVAIFNSPERLNEYGTISRDIKMGNSSMHVASRADAYVDYVADVVRPHIEKSYLVRTGRGATAIGGSSMGGLVAIHAAIKRPDVFGKVLAASPSLWFDKGIIGRAAATADPIDLYIDNGGIGAEGDNAPYVAQLRDAMDAKPQGRGNVWHWFAPNAGHTESAWRERFPRAFSALFAR